ncbi:MAG: NADH-quinone oxidoreductase subunit C, partial [Conexivisphaerales archaeon]
PDKQEFELNYIVGSMDDDKRNNIIMLVTRIPKSNPSLRTVSDVWKAAKLEEREEFEMLGVNFLGNDELQKLYLPEDWNEIPPLLKEYKLKRWVDEERNRHGLVIEKVEHEH